MRIFEVDHPASQAMKRERLLAINGSVPANLVLVPVDFERDRLDEKLMEAGFDRGAPAFFSWLGTTYYLTKEAIRDTLERVSAVTAAGSRIVLDYKYPRRLIPEQSLLFADKVDQFVAKRGEPMRSTFAPEELTAELARTGFSRARQRPARGTGTALPAGTQRHAAAGRQLRLRPVRPPIGGCRIAAASY